MKQEKLKPRCYRANDTEYKKIKKAWKQANKETKIGMGRWIVKKLTE